MRRKSSSGEQLLILTLALEEALRAENWAEAGQLFAARSAVLDRAECDRTPLSRPVIDQVGAAEERILNLLNERRTVITRGLVDHAYERKASRLYKPAGRKLGFEGIG